MAIQSAYRDRARKIDIRDAYIRIYKITLDEKYADVLAEVYMTEELARDNSASPYNLEAFSFEIVERIKREKLNLWEEIYREIKKDPRYQDTKDV